MRMRPLGGLGIGVSLVFGCLLLALVAELYYLLWWKKKRAIRDLEGDYSSSAREFSDLFCWKKPSSLSSTALNIQDICTSVRVVDDSDDSQSKDYLMKPFTGDDSLDVELMRLHSLSGPPRFLFTIKEETKEDLESEDGRSRGDKSRKGSRGKSLSDVLLSVETPFLTPLSSPPFFTPPLTPLDYYSQRGLNPLFESSKEDELIRVRSSPPPKFKFLKDAEEKLYRRTLMEEAFRIQRNGGCVEENLFRASPPVPAPMASASPPNRPVEDGSFITFMIGKNREKGYNHQQHSGLNTRAVSEKTYFFH